MIDSVDPKIILEVLQQKEEQRKKKIKARIKARKAAGLPVGRPPIPIPKEFKPIKKKWEKEEITIAEACYLLKINPRTFKKWLQYKQ